MPLWRLPDNLSDVLPTEARQLEALRHQALNMLRTWGYEMVCPPLLEQLSALTTGTAQDLDAVMFKVVDPLSGQLLGVRADVTPQAARIDAHLLNREGPTRLCYCAPALRSHVSDAFSQRELLQLGAELFGHAGIEADTEIQDLAIELLKTLSASPPFETKDASRLAAKHLTLALSHSGVLSAVFDGYPALRAHQFDVLAALRSKNKTDLTTLCQTHLSADQSLGALQLLLTIANAYGAPEELAATRFAAWPLVAQAVEALQALAARAHAQGANVMLDLADLNGYGYHTGVQFAVYVRGLTTALLRGGRYDGVGQVFGRARAATGFSLDLRTLASLLPSRSASPAVLAPWGDNVALNTAIAQLRSQGHVVVRHLPGHVGELDEFYCDRALVHTEAGWQIQSI